MRRFAQCFLKRRQGDVTSVQGLKLPEYNIFATALSRGPAFSSLAENSISRNFITTRSSIRTLSTSQAAKRSLSPAIRKMVKPFLLKCHPDVLPLETAKHINLRAIQNLNNYLDTIYSMANGTLRRPPESSVVEVDFVIKVSEQAGVKKKIVQNISRRKVDLLYPPHTSPVHEIEEYSAQQMAKLLRVAGLSVPVEIPEMQEDDDVHRQDHQRHYRSRYEETRDIFTANIDWEKYEEVYNRAMADMHADMATQGLLKRSGISRRKLIASILSKIRMREDMELIEQMVALRRLTLLFDDNFDDLHLEECGTLWESMTIVLGPPRQFNVSGSALKKRQQRHGDTGFSFALHPDYSVTVEIPLDFTDQEFLLEMDRNLWDFYDIVGDGMDEIFRQTRI